ncbi:MepB family protein [Lysinibacillus parviboronicapiens]|uniref:MepB family protein n=1 Tax=Lysinibacillus parviboronicapiens TaxID=436516 RepID=UPI000D399D3E|nr:MepB family protein [Lysinibacillus parviboronicapiens]
MNTFYNAVTFINNKIYEPNNLIIENIQEEQQNSQYGAGKFQLNLKSIRFRVAKITPTKIGQFVAFWEKDRSHKNQPYQYRDFPDLLVITTFNGNRVGQFVFPKELLLKKGILQTDEKKGKMAIRVYPSWDKPTNKQAITTQKWQIPYFIDITDKTKVNHQRVVELYS